MKLSTIAIALACSGAFGLSAAPLPCISETLSALSALGSTGCTSGGLTLFNFQTDPALADIKSTAISPTQVNVSFQNLGGIPQIVFQSLETATNPVLLEVVIGFQASGPVNFVGLQLNQASATGNGAALSFLQICPGGTYDAGGNCSATETTLAGFQDVTGTGDLSVNTGIAPTVNTVGFIDAFSVDGGTNGSASAAGSSIQVGQVPEPSSSLLLFSGGVILAIITNKFNKESKSKL